MNKIITSLLIAASLLITAPSAFAARGDDGYQKHKQFQSNRHQRSQNQAKHRSKTWRTNKRYNQSDRKKHFNKNHRSSRHDSKHGTRKHGTRKHDKHNNRHGTRHINNHKPRHSIKHGPRYGTRQSIHHKPRKYIKKHVKKHYPRRYNNHRYYNDHDSYDSWFLDFFTVAPFYATPSYNAPVYTRPGYKKTYKTNIWDRQKNQQRRINRGMRSGQLTHHEARFLRRELQKIRDRIAYYKSDGHFSHYERKEIQRMLDRSSDYIYKRKHNSVTRDAHQYDGGYDYYH